MHTCEVTREMLTQEWDEIKEIFEHALTVAGPDRSRYLDAACAEKPALRETVTQLLNAHEEASGFLEDGPNVQPGAPVFHTGELIAERFRIIRFISRGGMGEVYEAYDERLALCIALKTMRPELAGDRDALERFRREIRVNRDFGHPNLCRIYELVEHRTRASATPIPCLTMQLLDGDTLQSLLAREGPLNAETALPLIRQISNAIDALHANGIIHRDLKPSNIMITRGRSGEQRAVVMDFGLAKQFETDLELFQSRTDSQVGAPFYLAPEVLRGEKPTAASDIYALGLVIDEMVTSSRAFPGDSLEAVLYEKVWGDPIAPFDRASGIPRGWSTVILRCLNRDPGKRPRTAMQIVSLLEAELPGATRDVPASISSKALRTGTTRWAKLRRWYRPRRTTIGVVTASVLVVGTTVPLLWPSDLETSLTVFPIENWTGIPDYEYLCKGTTAEVLRRLIDIPGTQVLRYDEPRSKVPEFVPKTRFSIEGHLQAYQQVRRLSVEVTENGTSRVVWMRDFDTESKDSLHIQDEIATGAVNALREAVLVTPGARNSAAAPFIPAWLSVRNWLWNRRQAVQPAPTRSAVAMEAYMRGHALYEERTTSALKAATVQYQRALQEDPHFALAYADLSAVELARLQRGTGSRAAILDRARSYAEKAVMEGPGYAESYTALAAVRQHAWDWVGADQAYRLAIKTNPKFARAHRWYGGFLIQFGKLDEGLAETRKAIQLDPYDYTGRMILGNYLAFAGRGREGAAHVEQCLREKDLPFGHELLADIYTAIASSATGQERASLLSIALKQADIAASDDRSGNIEPGVGLAAPMYARIYALMGNRVRAEEFLQKMGAPSADVSAEDLASVYVALGENERALDVLRRAAAIKDYSLLYLKVDPFLEPLHGSPEFPEILKQVHLQGI